MIPNNVMTLKMSKLFYKYILVLLSVLLPEMSYGSSFTLVIDAGHGGHDAGAIGTYSKDKNINLNVALKVGELIRRNCPDVKLIYTRSTDKFVDLHERAAIANRAKADLFISIHTNALPNGRQAVGAETYSLGMARSSENLDVAKRENSVILYENDYQKRYAGFNPRSSESYIIFEFMQDQYMKQSVELARAIQNQYVKMGRQNKGVKQAGFLVLRETSMPSVLTELGFISTPSEEQYLNSAKGTDDMARSIYLGFLDYKESYQRGKSVVLSNAGRENASVASTAVSPSTDKKEETKEIPQPDAVETPSVSGKTENETKKAAQPEVKKQNEKERETSVSTNKKTEENNRILFKVQILTSSKMLRLDSNQFKGLSNISYYKENDVYKYTYGASTSYKEIVALRKGIIDRFPGCFVIALKGDTRIGIQEAQAELSK